jgi:hypothetical protein
VDDRLAELAERLAAIEEELRDLAYDRLAEAAHDGDPTAAADEQRLLRARRAVARAVEALRPGARDEGDA